LTDRHRDRRADADWSKAHDDHGELEHHVGQSFAYSEQGLFRPSLHLGKSDRKEYCEKDHLQHFVIGASLEDALRHQMLEESGPRLRLMSQFLTGRGRPAENHTLTRPNQIYREQADEQRQRSDDLEIDDRLER